MKNNHTDLEVESPIINNKYNPNFFYNIEEKYKNKKSGLPYFIGFLVFSAFIGFCTIFNATHTPSTYGWQGTPPNNNYIDTPEIYNQNQNFVIEEQSPSLNPYDINKNIVLNDYASKLSNNITEKEAARNIIINDYISQLNDDLKTTTNNDEKVKIINNSIDNLKIAIDRFESPNDTSKLKPIKNSTDNTKKI